MSLQREEFLMWPAAAALHPLSRGRAAEALRNSRQLLLRVFGCSMLPAVWPGDVLVITPAELGHLASGDLILFSRDERLFVHRLLMVHRNVAPAVLIARGDALPQDDPPLPAFQVLGRVIAILRNGRPVRGMHPSLAQKVFAWALRHAGAVYPVLLRLHERRRHWAGAQQSELVGQNAKSDNPVVAIKE